MVATLLFSNRDNHIKNIWQFEKIMCEFDLRENLTFKKLEIYLLEKMSTENQKNHPKIKHNNDDQLDIKPVMSINHYVKYQKGITVTLLGETKCNLACFPNAREVQIVLEFKCS